MRQTRQKEGKFLLQLLDVAMSKKPVDPNPIYGDVKRMIGDTWRMGVFERDKWKCRNCHVGDQILDAHHVKGISLILVEKNITTKEQAKQCKELFDIKNGVALCRRCHKKYHMMLNILRYSGKRKRMSF